MTSLAFEKDTEPYAVVRDDQITAIAKDRKVDLIVPSGHTLYDVASLIKANKGR